MVVGVNNNNYSNNHSSRNEKMLNNRREESPRYISQLDGRGSMGKKNSTTSSQKSSISQERFEQSLGDKNTHSNNKET